jgi:hypothetical protein
MVSTCNMYLRTKLLGVWTFSSSGVLGSRNITFWKLDPQVKREKTPTRFGPFHLRTETDPVSETSCFFSLEHRMTEKVKTPSLSVCYTPSSEPYKIHMYLRVSKNSTVRTPHVLCKVLPSLQLQVVKLVVRLVSKITLTTCHV